MMPNNLFTIYLSGNNSELVLFQSAIHWAELGETVWFISPRSFDSLPEVWKNPPDKDVLKYINERNDLLAKLSEIHLWQKTPRVIIVTEIEHYFFPSTLDSELADAALIAASLLDAAKTYATKRSETSFLIVAKGSNLQFTSAQKQKLQTLIDLYFSTHFNISDTDIDFLTDIVPIFNTQITK